MRPMVLLLAVALGAAVAVAAAGEPIAVIVSSPHAETRLDLADLALIYQRKRLYWPDGQRIQPVNLAAQDTLRLAFSRAVLGADPAALDSYWNEQYFHGVRPPYVVASSEAMQRFVADTPGAIGYVAACGYAGAAPLLGVLDAEGRWHRTHSAPACPSAP